MRLVLCLSLLTLVIAAPLGAYEFDEARWSRDAGDFRRLDDVATNLRNDFVGFASSYRTATAMNGEQHVVASATVRHYAKLRRYLGTIADRWADALPPRPGLNDGVDGRLRGTALAAAAQLCTLQNALCLVECFGGTIWAKRLDQRESGTSEGDVVGLFHDVARHLAAGEYQDALKTRLDFLEARTAERDLLAAADPTFARLLRRLDDAATYAAAGRKGVLARAGDRLKEGLGGLRTRLDSALNATLARLYSGPEENPMNKNLDELKALPNRGTMGPIAGQVVAELTSLLQPGDVLVGKSRGDVWDRVIPGYFMHGAVYLGTPAQMEALGLFDPAVNKVSRAQAIEYRSKLLEGRNVIECDFPGVELNPLELFPRWYSAVAVLRPKGVATMTPEQRRAHQAGILCRALRVLGRPYDFVFDVDTDDRVFCSELVYLSYPRDIDWMVVKRAGRNTFSPDDLAMIAGPDPGQPFEVLYYNDEGATATGADAWRPMWRSLKGSTETLFPKPGSTDERWLDVIANVRP